MQCGCLALVLVFGCWFCILGVLRVSTCFVVLWSVVFGFVLDCGFAFSV